jgi:uncharacterized protein with von Willebrand factor type A (vWA) domain
MAIKTNWNEVNQIIKEEFQRLMTKNKLKSRIKQINEELGQMDDEDNALEEVEAAGTEKLAPGQSFGGGQGEKFKPKFEKKGSHLLEDEDEDTDDTLEIGVEGGEGEDESEENGELNLADEFAELGAAIEAKIKAVLGGSSEDTEGAEGAEEFEEVEVSDEDAEGAEGAEGVEGVEGVEGNIEGTEDEDKEEVDEYAETQGGVGAEQGMTTDQALKESTGSKKQVIAETKKSTYLNILSEGLDKNQKSALQNEVDRMRKLAKLDNNE